MVFPGYFARQAHANDQIGKSKAIKNECIFYPNEQRLRRHNGFVISPGLCPHVSEDHLFGSGMKSLSPLLEALCCPTHSSEVPGVASIGRF